MLRDGDLQRESLTVMKGKYLTENIPQGISETIISLKVRTDAIAKHLTDFLKKTNQFDKTIIFCVDQEHAEDMRKALNTFNASLVKEHPDYVCRVVSEEGDIGRGHLQPFSGIRNKVTCNSHNLKASTTGVDMPTCKNVVIVKVINSMTDFKQIIGRGTRVRDDYGKLYFTILDYTGSATRLLQTLISTASLHL